MGQPTSFKYSVVTALVAGVVLLVLTYGYVFHGPQVIRESHMGLTSLVVMYVSGGFIGGVIYWLTQPLMAWGHPGRGLVGFLSAAPLGVALGMSTLPATTAPEYRIIYGMAMAALMGGGYFMVDH